VVVGVSIFPAFHVARQSRQMDRRGANAMMFSTFGQLLDSLVAAIIRQEGRPETDTNPGDLRVAPWIAAGLAHYKLLAGNGEFWNPITREFGIAGIYHVAMLHIAEAQTLEAFVYMWAPPSENNSAAYLKNVREWTGIGTDARALYEMVESPPPS
jgi:hypothetical protein